MKSLRIVFMGTPDFAVPSLDLLFSTSIHQIVGVVTVPDKPSGRGQLFAESAVKKYAIQHQIPILQPDKLKEEHFLTQLKSWQADIFVIVAFRMLPAEVWKIPALKTINLHGSLLPLYRGAAPINRAIMNGATETGVTTFFIDETMDTGNLLFAEKIAIEPDEDAGMLHDKMKIIGAQLLLKTIDAIVQNNITPIAQSEIKLDDNQQAMFAPKIFPTDCNINWNNEAQRIVNQIRGLSPHPGAFTLIEQPDGIVRKLKIFKSTILNQNISEQTGTFVIENNKKLFISAKDAWIAPLEVQLDGKKRMNIDDFLRGFEMAACKII
jgi:methionyl-tRNA formyltransferase